MQGFSVRSFMVCPSHKITYRGPKEE